MSEEDHLRELIFVAAEHGIGITIEPYGEDGWKIGCMFGMGGDDLTIGRTLDDAAYSAMLPLREMIDRSERNTEQR